MGGQMATTLCKIDLKLTLIAICTKGMKRFTVFASLLSKYVVVKSSVEYRYNSYRFFSASHVSKRRSLSFFMMFYLLNCRRYSRA